MSRYLVIAAFCFLFGISAYAQSNANYASPQTVVKYDAYTRIITGTIPFDKPFKIEVDNIDTSGISSVQIYEVQYVHGKRQMREPYGASTVLPQDAIIRSKNTLTLNLPGIQAEKNFDIAISRKNSTSNISRIYSLNKSILVDYNGQTVATIYAAKPLQDAFKLLTDSLSGFRRGAQYRGISPDLITIKDYYEKVYINVTQYYNDIRDIQPLRLSTYDFGQNEITLLSSKLDDKNAFFVRLPLLQKVIDDGKFNEISRGLLAFDYKYPIKTCGLYDIEQRLKNLTKNSGFIDSLLNVAIRPVETKDYAHFHHMAVSLQNLLNDINDKRDYLQNRMQYIIKEFNKYIPEQTLWLNGTDDFTDLKVKGASIFTLDAGIMDVFTKDNYNKMVEIPKLFLGVNIYFLPNDKTLSNNYLKPLMPTDDEQHTLESQPSFWRSASVTIGVTLGAMQNTQFDNVTNGLSFTIGPSFRFYKAFRFSFGAAMLRRATDNPLMSDKKIVPGAYAGLSIDFDLLDPIKNVTSMIFK